MKRIITIKGFLIAAAALFSAALHAQKSDSSYTFSLQEAQNFALQNNKEVINAQLDIQAAKAKIKETTAIGLPQVEASATFTHVFDVPVLDFGSTMSGGSGSEQTPVEGVPLDFQRNFGMMMGSIGGEPSPIMEENNVSYDITATQLIFSGEYIVGLRASKAYKAYSEINAELVEESTKETVANSYFAVLIAQENVTILDSNIIAVQSMVDEMQRMVDVGLVDQNDADQLKLNLANLKATRTQIALQAQLARRLLKYNLGLPMDSEVALSENFEQLLTASNAQNVETAFNAESHTQYQMLEVNENLMKLSMQREKTTLLPTLAAFATYKGYLEEPAMMMEPKSMIGLKLTVPIFGSGMKLYKIKQAKIEYLKAQNTKSFATEGLYLAVAQAENELTVAVEQYEIQKESMALAERIFSQTIKKQKRGMASSFDLTTAQNQFLQAQQAYFQAMFMVLSKKIALDKAYGNL